ncbi:hypothetical protein SEA_NERGAL_49 [Mycobacterium Phage Nergal]|nr:hypothetical protein SEA_NERGAL_49 [Mycobacterium Phage Nergal]
MSDSTRPLCQECGEYEARVFDPSGAMWCHRCVLVGIVSASSSGTEAGDPEAWQAPTLADPAAMAWAAGKSSHETDNAATSDDALADTIGEQTDDPVNHPSHYTSSPATCSNCGQRIEAIDITRHMGFNLGNTTKYVWRCDLKHDAIEDLRKAAFYLADEIARRERQLALDNKG